MRLHQPLRKVEGLLAHLAKPVGGPMQHLVPRIPSHVSGRCSATLTTPRGASAAKSAATKPEPLPQNIEPTGPGAMRPVSKMGSSRLGQLRHVPATHAPDWSLESGACTAVHPRASPKRRRPPSSAVGSGVGPLTKHTSSKKNPTFTHDPISSSCDPLQLGPPSPDPVFSRLTSRYAPSFFALTTAGLQGACRERPGTQACVFRISTDDSIKGATVSDLSLHTLR